MTRQTLLISVFLAAACLAAVVPASLGAQNTTRSAATGTLRLRVVRDSTPIENVVVRARHAAAITDEHGAAILQLPAATDTIVAARLGFRPETLVVTMRAGLDTAATIPLVVQTVSVAPVIVTSTRTERRIEEEPLRVEVLSGEDIAEKSEMRPADLRNLLHEMSGVHVQSVAPTLGGASLRIQGLPGRYTLVLNDGLPLYGTQASGFGLVQQPPLDLRQAEVIKGAASSLYGPSALGGVVDLVSRRPPDTSQVLLNQTARGGTDLLAFLARPLSATLGVTLLAGVHRQRIEDADRDAWTDIPGLRRTELRPRVFWSDDVGHSAMVTAGGFDEDRAGQGVAGPSGDFTDSLATRHGDVGAVARWRLSDALSLAFRGSANVQDRRRVLAGTAERERQATLFGEAAVTAAAGSQVVIAGVAWQRDDYRHRDVPRFDRLTSTPALFVQYTLTPASWLATTLNGRCDASSAYGTICTPRASVLVHSGSALSARLSTGGGWFAPSALPEEAEAIGLSRVSLPAPLSAERGRTASLDVTATRGPLQMNGTLFANRVARPVRLAPLDSARVALVNAPGSLRTHGGEIFAVWNEEPIVATAYYAVTRSQELDPASGRPREAPLVPREEAGLDLAFEEEESGSYVAVEAFYTGRQALEDDPSARVSQPFNTFGLLASQRIGRATLFVNLENLTNVRLSRFESVGRASAGAGGRWSVDPWAPLGGRAINAGLRIAF